MTAGTIDMIARPVLAPGSAPAATAATVSSTYLEGVVEFAVTRGTSRTALFRAAGLHDADLGDGNRRHPIEHLIALLRAGAELESEPAFALRFGQYVPCEQVALAAPLGRSARNVVDALKLVSRYAPLGIHFPALQGRDRYEFVRDSAGLWLCDQRPADRWPEITELVFSRMVHGIRRIQDTDVVKALFVRHPAPLHCDNYYEVFCVPVHFGADRNAILLDPSYLQTTLVPGPAHVTRILATHADAQLASLENAHTCRGRLESELRAALHTGDVSVASMTRRMAMSRQTLYRRLKREGTTYDEVLAALRRDIAVEAMRNGTTAVKDLAALVGFADPAAFSRAFKRWTGKSPTGVSRSRTSHAPES